MCSWKYASDAMGPTGGTLAMGPTRVSHRCAAGNNASNAIGPTCETLFLLSYLTLLCRIKVLTSSPSIVLYGTEVIVHLLPSQPQLT